MVGPTERSEVLPQPGRENVIRENAMALKSKSDRVLLEGDGFHQTVMEWGSQLHLKGVLPASPAVKFDTDSLDTELQNLNIGEGSPRNKEKTLFILEENLIR